MGENRQVFSEVDSEDDAFDEFNTSSWVFGIRTMMGVNYVKGYNYYAAQFVIRRVAVVTVATPPIVENSG